MGNCYGDDNPDAWFPESPQGSQTPTKMKLLALSVNRAISLCNSCPKQEACLQEGMIPKNLPYGIWGGKLAGERLLMADAQGVEYMVTGRTRGTRTAVGSVNSTGRGVAKGFVVIKENDKVTAEEKKMAISFLRRIKPWIKE